MIIQPADRLSDVQEYYFSKKLKEIRNLNTEGKKIINSLSYIIGALLFTGIAIGGWTDMIKGWEIREYQGIGAIEFPVYPIRTVIIFSSIIIVFIYLTLIFKTFVNDKKKSLTLY